MALVLAGCIVAIMGLVPYCAASFAGDASADLGAIVFHGAAPAARGSLLVVAAGTLLWIVGAVVHATAALVTADERPGR